MGFDVTDYNATTGVRTGEFELNLDRMPEPKPNIIRKIRDNRTAEVRWMLPSGAVSPLKPRGLH